MNQTEPLCDGCEHSRANSHDGVYCRLFGIMIHRDHTGCKYHSGGDGNGPACEPGAGTGLDGGQ